MFVAVSAIFFITVSLNVHIIRSCKNGSVYLGMGKISVPWKRQKHYKHTNQHICDVCVIVNLFEEQE